MRLQGVSGGYYNARFQFIGATLLVPSLKNLVIETPAPADLFSIPVRPIHIILRLGPVGASDQRVHVQGIVTLQRPGKTLFIRDAQEGLEVETRQTIPLEIGDRVDVVGFPAVGDFSPVLQDAVYRKIGAGAAPPAPLVTAAQALLGGYDSELIRMQGRLVGFSLAAVRKSLTIDADGPMVEAELEGRSGEEMPGHVRVGKLKSN